MSDHTPAPWNCATAYSSVVGVPIIARNGKRIGNTALPDMPKEWDSLKEEAVANAAFICRAVNSYEPMRKALEAIAGGSFPSASDLAISGSWKIFVDNLQALARGALTEGEGA